MLNLDAPLLPRQSAGGIRLSQSIDSVLAAETPDGVVELKSCTKFQFGPVNLWVTNGTVSQVGVYAGYRGSLCQVVRVGSTLAQVLSALGRVVEDEQDNLIVQGMTGWCFETDEWTAGPTAEENPLARVTAIFVHNSGG